MEKEIEKKFQDIKNLVGNTPMVEIKYKFLGKARRVFAKLEAYNLTGSIKDRVAYQMLKAAYQKGELKKGQPICETTSGNMGISIAAVAKILGNPVIICMPRTMSVERQALIKLYGAKLELTDNFEYAFKKAEEYGKNGAFLTHQFENSNNTAAHYKTTAREIFSKKKDVSCFVSGVGTGGTLMGVGRFLKKKCNAEIVAIDPEESSILTLGKSKGCHKIQGLSDGLIPKLYDRSLVDRIVAIDSDDAIAMSRKLCMELGLAVGISSGANFLGCALSGHSKAVTIFADDNKKYLSTDLANFGSTKTVEKIELISYKTI